MAGSPDSDIAKTDPLAPNGVEHRDEPVRPGLHRRTIVDRHRIRAADAEEIGRDQTAERRQPVEVGSDRGLVPQQVDRERRGGDEEQIGPAVTDDLVREVDVAVPCVNGLRDGRHAHEHATRIRVIYRCWQNRQPYDPNLHGAAQKPPTAGLSLIQEVS
jgi:hypothetical protein